MEHHTRRTDLSHLLLGLHELVRIAGLTIDFVHKLQALVDYPSSNNWKTVLCSGPRNSLASGEPLGFADRKHLVLALNPESLPTMVTVVQRGHVCQCNDKPLDSNALCQLFTQLLPKCEDPHGLISIRVKPLIDNE